MKAVYKSKLILVLKLKRILIFQSKIIVKETINVRLVVKISKIQISKKLKLISKIY